MKIKNVFDKLISEFDTTEKKLMRLNVGQQKLYNLKCQKQNKERAIHSKLYNNIKQSNICILGTSERKERGKRNI